jgi:hypothetical protein
VTHDDYHNYVTTISVTSDDDITGLPRKSKTFTQQHTFRASSIDQVASAIREESCITVQPRLLKG